MHILFQKLMKNLEFHVFKLGGKTWTQLSKRVQGSRMNKEKMASESHNPLGELSNGLILA